MSEAEISIKTIKKLARKTHDCKMNQRYNIVRLYLEGYPKKEIASIMSVSLPTVYSILNHYAENGVKGLFPGRATGRKRKLSEDQEKILYQTISEKIPEDLGLGPFAKWTSPLACQFVKNEFHILFSERGMRDVFYRIGLSHTRPTYVLAQADPEKQAAFRNEEESIKKTVKWIH